MVPTLTAWPPSLARGSATCKLSENHAQIPSHLISSYLSVLVFKKWESWQQFHKAASESNQAALSTGQAHGSARDVVASSRMESP